MGKCNKCGKKGLFLFINAKGRCKECEEKYQQEERNKEQVILQKEKKAPELLPKQDNIQLDRSNKVAQPSEAIKYQEAFFLDIIEEHYILSYKYDRVNIAFPVMGKVAIGDFLSLEPEPDNEFDQKAIKVLYGIDKIGYLYRGKIQDMVNDYIHKGLPIDVRVDSMGEDKITCAIAFYKDMESFESIVATLTKTTKKDIFDNSRQDNLSGVSEGDLLNIEFDFETESYLVSDEYGNEIGELSSNVSNKLSLREDDYTYKAICIENEIDDNLKYKCKIKIILT